MLEIKDLHVSYGGIQALRGVSLNVPDGKIVTLIGANGAGKSTLMRTISGLVKAQSGSILWNGQELLGKPIDKIISAGIAMSPEGRRVFADLTVLENLSLADNKGRRYGLQRGVERKRIDAYRQMLAELGLGLEEKLNVKMGSLSGGQRQALALLMATMTPLKFLILDEHTAALDPKTAAGIMERTDRIVRKKKLTALMVTHNLRYALDYGDRLLMLDRGKILLDRTGAEKAATSPEDVLSVFQRADMGLGFC